MKIKKVLNIILIFVIIQVISMFFANTKVYAEGESFFEKSFKASSDWKSMGEGNASTILNNATNVTSAIDDITNAVRIIGIGIFLVNIVFLFITLSMNNNGKDVAGAKLAIGITFVLALMFIFADKIIEFLTGLGEQVETIM